MNRETWFRILQIAIVAPFIYTISEQQKNAYFKLGLKLVAGSIIVMNIEPLIKDLQPLIQAAARLKIDADTISAQQKRNAIEGEFTETAKT